MDRDTSFEFTVMGDPVGKGRPRFTVTGRGARAYTPARTASFEHLVRLEFENAGGWYFGEGKPLMLTVKAFLRIPASATKATKWAMMKDSIRPTKKPDIDNVLKIVGDALNGVAYADDKQIVAAYVEKRYSDIPHTVIRISEVI